MRFFLSISALAVVLCSSASAQEQPQNDAEAFASENAIVDTSIPFAIGAREARQELRGAFGWPTFQEGLVEGVYFRFDPDGYARFAPSPRLDTDVFEVICRPGTLNCLGRKGPLGVYLNGQGALQLQIDEVQNGDTLSIVEGVTELPLPKRVLMPLDARMETLLGSGGELVVKRGEAAVTRVSLAGFLAVTTYLRWITAQQDYGVLPRGWPVPNSTTSETTTAQTDTNWRAPASNNNRQPVYDRAEDPAQSDAAKATDLAEVRGELNALRDLLLSRRTAAPNGEGAAENPNEPLPPTEETTGRDAEVKQLQDLAQSLMKEIERLQDPALAARDTTTPMQPLATDEMAKPVTTTLGAASTAPNDPQAEAGRIAKQLEYLMSEIGLDAKTALMLVQSGELEGQSSPDPAQTMPTDQPVAESNDVVLDILAELRSQLPAESEQTNPEPIEPKQTDPAEFQLLTEYFKSVFKAKSH